MLLKELKACQIEGMGAVTLVPRSVFYCCTALWFLMGVNIVQFIILPWGYKKCHFRVINIGASKDISKE